MATVENSMVISNKNQTEISRAPAIALLSIYYPEELKAGTQMDT